MGADVKTDLKGEVVLNNDVLQVEQINNGHAIQLNIPDGSAYQATMRDWENNTNTYSALQMHFHVPSEHTVDGQQYGMEAHLVMQAPNLVDGRNLAVLGFLF